MKSREALGLLLENINSMEDLIKPENKWILHCYYVGKASQRIAHAINENQKMNIDEDKALTVGYMHDIGRKINHPNHTIEGYNYLTKLGHPDIARYCLTHSFVDNHIPNTIGGVHGKERYEFIKNFLEKTPVDIYDNIVQLCDLFCLETGVTTFEKRILDVTKRKGVYENSRTHFKSIMALKERIENLMGKKVYDLFPEISKEDLDSVEADYNELMELFKTNDNIKRK